VNLDIESPEAQSQAPQNQTPGGFHPPHGR
jgi:hypothetical protein